MRASQKVASWIRMTRALQHNYKLGIYPHKRRHSRWKMSQELKGK